MTGQTIPDGAVRELLAVIYEAVAIPFPATVGDAEIHNLILLRRAEHVRTGLERVLASRDPRLPLDLAWETAYLRDRLAEHPPTGYRHLPPVYPTADDPAAGR